MNPFEYRFEEDDSRFGWKTEFDDYFEGLEPFKYEPLKTDRSIRLIQMQRTRPVPRIDLTANREYWGNLIHPSDSDDEMTNSKSRHMEASAGAAKRIISRHKDPVDYYFQPVEVSVVEVTLDKLPEFETISYVWGDGNARALICDEKLLRVSRNCVLALYYISICLRPSATALFWIDQICIDQSNLAEKAQQVSIMHSIYSSATRTLGWIGEADKIAWHVFDTYRTNSDGFCGRRSYNPVNPDSLQGFIEKLYFKRGWIVPEAALSQNMLLLCGEFSISWQFFESLKEACIDLARDVHGGRRISIRTISIFSSLRQQDGTRIQQTRALMDAMKLIDFVNVTDERDRLYALASLNEELANLVGPPDYTVSSTEVWRRLFQSIITSYGPNSCLLWQIVSHFSGALPLKTIEHCVPSWMPSWMPDMSAGPPAHNRRCLTQRPALYQCCQRSTQAADTERSKPTPSVQFPDWTLSCQAKFVDTLSDRIIHISSDLANTLRSNPSAREKIQNYRPCSSTDPIGFLFRIVGDFKSRYPTSDTDLPLGNAQAWLCMSLFATASGNLAVVPKYSFPGDRIVWFAGNSCSRQLSVVRKNDDGTFRYIGTAFGGRGWTGPFEPILVR